MSLNLGGTAFLIALVLTYGGIVTAQTTDNLPDYVALLPQVKASAPVIDPAKGYLVQTLKVDDLMIRRPEST